MRRPRRRPSPPLWYMLPRSGLIPLTVMSQKVLWYKSPAKERKKKKKSMIHCYGGGWRKKQKQQMPICKNKKGADYVREMWWKGKKLMRPPGFRARDAKKLYQSWNKHPRPLTIYVDGAAHRIPEMTLMVPAAERKGKKKESPARVVMLRERKNECDAVKQKPRLQSRSHLQSDT